MGKFFKTAGILDPVQNKLSPAIFDESGKMHSSLKAEMLERLTALVPIESVKHFYLLGSTAGYQYEDDSDIDGNAFIYPVELLTPELDEKRFALNGKPGRGMKHPINIFLQPYLGKAPDFQDAKLGVYDIFNDVWVSSPGKPEDTRPPEDDFQLEMISGRMIAQEFMNLVDRYIGSIKKYKQLKDELTGTLNEPYLHTFRVNIKNQLDYLLDFVEGLDNERKFEYGEGWGTPRKSWRNIVFKLIEHSKYGDIFEHLKEMKHETELKNG